MHGDNRDIALIGYACRLPSASNSEEFWNVLADGRCVIGEVSPDRWATTRFGHPNRSVPGKSYTWAAGQLDDVWGFDPGFFGISPREAIQIDPQQRLLLQVVWESLENAGIPPSKIAGNNVGVYVGASSLDYSYSFMLDPAAGDVQLMTGNTLSIIANRVSYIFDLRGPSFTLDTACSSSLVALHQALEAIRAGHIDTAVVCGVQLLLSPFAFLGFSRASMLSPAGLCRAFDADGEGYVRSEGAVSIVIRAADVARAEGDTIRSVLVASGINSDGRTVGLSLPSSQSQAALLDDIYRDFEIDPNSLAFVEAHGTGTRVGDPAETEALGRVLGQKRDDVLRIGSVKTNIGHLEPASGLAGLLKAQLALERDVLPASLHFDTPNPDIAFDELNLEVVTEATPLPRRGEPRYAGVNSFGFGGTNAHVVLRDPDPVADGTSRADERAPLVLSAQSAEALSDLARSYRDQIEQSDNVRTAELVNAAAYKRDRLDRRLVVLGRDRQEKLIGLDAYLAEDKSTSYVEARAVAKSAEVAFLFSGNGSQWAGMARDSYQSDPDFRVALERVDRRFISVAGWSLLTTLFSQELDSEIERTEVAQPLLFAVQVAITEALAKRGLRPSAVTGHSVGEVAAAWCAGALDLDQAVRVIHARSTHQEVTRHLGGMSALLLAEDAAREAISPAEFDGIELAAVNSPRSVTISGPTEMLDAFGKYARKRRWAARRLNLDYPFHCALVDPIEEPLRASLKDLNPVNGDITFVSAVRGDVAAGDALNVDYWWDNVRHPVLFKAALETLADMGHRVLVEIGPRPVLNTYANDTYRSRDISVACIPSLDKDDSTKVDPIGRIVANTLASGGAVEDSVLFGKAVRSDIVLTAYPWQNQPYRIENTVENLNYFAGEGHPLLGYSMRPEVGEWFNHVDEELIPLLRDHKVEDSVIFPAAGFVEMALAAGRAWFKGDAIELRDMDIMRPLVADGHDTRETLLRISPDDLVFEISSRARLSDDDWSLHVRGTLSKLPETHYAFAGTGEAEGAMDAERLYKLTEQFGLFYGPAFQRAESVEISGEKTARVTFKEPSALTAEAGFLLDPTLLDSLFHGLFALVAKAGDAPANTSYLPVRIGRLRLFDAGIQATQGVIRVTKASRRSIEATFELIDADGNVVAVLEATRFRAVPLARKELPDELVYRTTGRRLGRPDEPSALADTMTGSILEGAGYDDLIGAVDDDRELSEAALLIDATARAIAHAGICAIAGGNLAALKLDEAIAAGRLASDARILANRLLLALESADVAEEENGGWRIAEDSGLPAAEDILRTIIAEHPDRIAEIALLTRLSGALPEILENGLVSTASAFFTSAMLDHLTTGSPSFLPGIDAVVAKVAELSRDWPRDLPLRVLQIGAANGQLTRALSDRLDAEFATLTVSDFDDQTVERAKVRATATPGLEHALFEKLAEQTAVDGGFDLVVAGNALAQVDERQLRDVNGLMAAGGALLATEMSPTLTSDLLFGVGADWWSETADPDYPVSVLRTADDWTALLTQAGFASGEIAAIADPDTEMLMIAGRAGERGKPAEDAEDVNESTSTIVLLTDTDGPARALADGLATTLKRTDHKVIVAVPGATSSETGDDEWTVSFNGDENRAAFMSLVKRDAETEIVHLAGSAASEDAPLEAVTDRTTALTELLQTLGNTELRLSVVAPGAAQDLFNEKIHRPTQTAVWSFGRVAANEFPNIELRLIDVAPALQPGEAAGRLADEILAPGNEREIVLDANRRSGIRIAHGGLLPAPEEFAGADQEAGYKLDIARQGSLDELVWHRVARREPEPDEVEIEMASSGLNFRDVMWALGLLPEEALEDGFAGPTLGMEGAGTVTRVGKDVTRYKPGDSVITFAPACFSTHVTVAERGCAPMPSTVSLEEAATIPVTFLTAYYALVTLAHLEEGETVLIHGGAGGVGLAALQLARWRGARVIATAGSEEKRAFLRMLGAEHVLDSRSLAFVDQIREITDGDGVDVVLNSLFGEAMMRSIDVLKPFGRFLELGKRDYYANTRIGLRPFRQNLSYFGIDADQLLTRQPKLADRIFAALVDLFEDGVLTPLPYRTFAGEDATRAFRLMQQSGHIGKIILTPPAATKARKPAEPLALRDDASYLIVGGFGGFGLETAKWLVEHGARHLAITSRRGAVTEEAVAAVKELEAAGVTVKAAACDVADKTATEALIAEIMAEMPPLRGVLHTAMVLDDALIANLDKDRIEKVLAPKIAGARNLDQLTRDLDIDLFVMFSSATTIVGNPGQANYVAANGYLEALARERRAAGLAGLAIAWGAIADAGYLARNTDVNEMLSRKLGRHALGAREALDGLGALLMHSPDAAVAYARIDWASARKELALLSTPLFGDLASDIDADTGDGGAEIDVHALIEGLDRGKAVETVAKLLAGEIARILRLPAEEVDRHRPLAEIGMDSLMALELRMAAEQRLGIDIPLMSIANGATLADISGRVTSRVLGEEGDSGVSAEMETIAQQHIDEATAESQDMAAIAAAIEEKSQSVRNFLK